MQACFQICILFSFPDQEHGQAKSDRHEANAQIKRLWPQAPCTGDVACCQGSSGYREIAGELIESHCCTTIVRSRQIDLHNDGGRPGQALADTEQEVSNDHPTPGRCPHEHERHGNRDDPASDQYCLAAIYVRKSTGEIIGQCFADAKNGDEGEYCRPRASMNSCSAIAGRILRSMPTIAPTNALTTMSSVNCARFAFSPRTGCSFLAMLVDIGAVTNPNIVPAVYWQATID